MVMIPILKGRNGGIERNDQTKIRSKLSRANIKSYSSMFSIQGQIVV
jgi:hypothetical protein